MFGLTITLMDSVIVGQRLKNLRKLSGLSQEALAERLGISYQQVQKYENGRSRITIERLAQFARIFGISEAEVLKGKTAQREVADPQGPFPRTGGTGIDLDDAEIEFLLLFRRLKRPDYRQLIYRTMKTMETLAAESQQQS